MVKTYIIRIINYSLLSIVLVSCASHEQKSDGAFKEFKENKATGGDSVVIVKEVTPQPMKVDTLVKTVKLDDWKKFESEIEKKILMNEVRIKEMRNVANGDAKWNRRVSRLEEENNELRTLCNEFPEEARVRREKVKTTIREGLKAIDSDLKKLVVENKKR